MRYWDYLTTIYRLSEAGIGARLSDVAEELDVKAPTAYRVLSRLVKEGYVSKRGLTYTLTQKGLEVAQQIVRRHRIIERFLAEILSVDPLESHILAHELEHAENFSERVDEYLGRPSCCPHGNPVPGRAKPASEVPLAMVKSGSYRISRIAELGEALSYASRTGLEVGAEIQVVGTCGDFLVIEYESQRLLIPIEVARLVYVTR